MQFVLAGQQFFAAGAGAVDVDRRIDTLFGDDAVQVQLHVAGALEFFVDHIVHARAGVDQGRGDDRQAAAFLDIAGRAEEALGPLQRVGVHAAGQHLARGRHDCVVGPREAGDGIQQDHHVFFMLDQPLGALNDHLRDLHMAAGRLVKGAGDHLGAHGAFHFGDLFGALVNQQDDQVDLRLVVRDGLGNALQDHGLAGLRRRHDQAALALADRRREVDDARRQIFRAAVADLQRQPLLRKQRRQVFKQDLVFGLVRRLKVDLVDLEQGEVAFAVLGGADLAGDIIALAQVKAADLARRDINIIRSGEIGTAGRSQEAEAVLQYLQDAVAVDILALSGVRLKNFKDDILFARAGQVIKAEAGGEGDQLRGGFLFQFGEVHRHRCGCGLGLRVWIERAAMAGAR